jgi:hypothetical protein
VRRLVSAVTTVVDYVLSRAVVSEPRICDACGRVFTRVTPAQCTEIGARRLPECRRWRCDGRLWPTRIEAER